MQVKSSPQKKMKTVAILFMTLLAAAAAAPRSVPLQQLSDAHRHPSSAKQLWLDTLQAFNRITRQTQWFAFKKAFGKTYEIEEDRIREIIFKENLRLIQWHNFQHAVGLKSYTLKVNEFADMSDEEFRETMSCVQQNKAMRTLCSSYLRMNLRHELPDSVDWRQKGYVTDVKNQKRCGSCWAFSSTGSLEGQYYRKQGDLVSMSEQNLVDCSGDFGNSGCNGGLMDYAFAYVKENGGIDSEATYPYEGVEGPCQYTASGSVTSVTGCMRLPSGDESALQEAVATVGPVSVAIDASHSSFRFYSGGIYDEDKCSSTKLDHGVLVVGYGQHQDVDYWIVKNSWGTSWGEAGYINMSRNKDNMCGIATHAVYPLL